MSGEGKWGRGWVCEDKFVSGLVFTFSVIKGLKFWKRKKKKEFEKTRSSKAKSENWRIDWVGEIWFDIFSIEKPFFELNLFKSWSKFSCPLMNYIQLYIEKHRKRFCVEFPLVRILALVANTQARRIEMRILWAEEGEGFVRTLIGHEWVGKRLKRGPERVLNMSAETGKGKNREKRARRMGWRKKKKKSLKKKRTFGRFETILRNTSIWTPEKNRVLVEEASEREKG